LPAAQSLRSPQICSAIETRETQGYLFAETTAGRSSDGLFLIITGFHQGISINAGDEERMRYC
jgi:hypothetical protein